MILEYALQNTLGLYLCEHLIFMQVQWVYCLVYVIDMESLIILYCNRPSNMSSPSLPEVFDLKKKNQCSEDIKQHFQGFLGSMHAISSI